MLAASRREITEWVSRDSRLSHTPIEDAHWDLAPGSYLQDYMQEFLLTQVGGGCAELSSMGDLLTVASRLHRDAPLQSTGSLLLGPRHDVSFRRMPLCSPGEREQSDRADEATGSADHGGVGG